MARSAHDQVLCPHCAIMVAKKTYRMHKRIYFDSATYQWVGDFSDEEFDISEDIHDNIQAAHISSSWSSIPPPIVDFDAVETSFEECHPGMMHIIDHSFIL